MIILTRSEIFKMHFDKFGTQPIITGSEFWSETPAELRVLRAIVKGIPYVEEQMEDGALT